MLSVISDLGGAEGTEASSNISYSKVLLPSRSTTTHRPLSSSFLGLPYGILIISHKKALLRGLWVNPKTKFICKRIHFSAGPRSRKQSDVPGNGSLKGCVAYPQIRACQHPLQSGPDLTHMTL